MFLTVVYGKSVNEQQVFVGVGSFQLFLIFHKLVNANKVALVPQPGIALLHKHAELFLECSPLWHMDGRKHHKLCSVGILFGALYHVFHAVFLHFLSRNRRYGLAYPCKEQAHVFVYFGRSAHCWAWVSRVNLLFDGNGRWQTLDEIAFGFAHVAEKLACVWWERLHITALPFGIKRVESQRRLARPANAGNGNELISRYVKADVFEVVYPYSL